MNATFAFRPATVAAGRVQELPLQLPPANNLPHSVRPLIPERHTIQYPTLRRCLQADSHPGKSRPHLAGDRLSWPPFQPFLSALAEARTLDPVDPLIFGDAWGGSAIPASCGLRGVGVCGRSP